MQLNSMAPNGRPSLLAGGELGGRARRGSDASTSSSDSPGLDVGRSPGAGSGWSQKASAAEASPAEIGQSQRPTLWPASHAHAHPHRASGGNQSSRFTIPVNGL